MVGWDERYVVAGVGGCGVGELVSGGAVDSDVVGVGESHLSEVVGGDAVYAALCDGYFAPLSGGEVGGGREVGGQGAEGLEE